jgi:hypothetical protein
MARTKHFVMALTLLVPLVGFADLTALAPPAAALQPRTGAICSGPLKAAVARGTDSGLKLDGMLTLSIRNEALAGSLREEGGATVRVSGESVDQEIALAFHLPSGVVKGLASFLGCSGTTSGSLAGPAPGDRGTWSVRWLSLRPPTWRE